MPIDAIGSTLNQQGSAATQNNTINQEDFIKLFLAQLQFQDPMEPVDNREFLAQLAQFSNLEQTRKTSENTEGLLVMNASAQALGLLGRTIELNDAARTTGRVTGVQFTQQGPALSIQTTTGNQALTGIRLSQVVLVTPAP